ncbi:myosin light chain, putative [Hepatocystis sp. ex Piliocolobus tephrosceles]|nr:myosin light chain, putative [Hepatocystis sp. ex Piliocolobus tephrosceles]
MEELTKEIELTALFNKISVGAKTINLEETLDIIYQLGYYPSKENIDEFVYTNNGIYSLSNIKKFCNKLESIDCSTEGLIDVFNHYDINKTGKISKEVIKMLFTNVGSKLSNSEMDIIISKLCKADEQVDYKEFLNKLLNQ